MIFHSLRPGLAIPAIILVAGLVLTARPAHALEESDSLVLAAAQSELVLAAAQAEEPLSGKAYRLADRAYQALAKGDIDEAEQAAREGLELRPDSRQLGLIWLDIQMRKGDLIKAQKQADALLARFPNDASVLAQRGYILQKQKQYPAAIRDFTAALRQPGLDAAQGRNVRVALADCNIAMKKPQPALDALAPLASTESHAVQIRIAQARLMLGDRAGARAAAEQAGKLAASDAERKSAQQLLLSAAEPAVRVLPKPKPAVQPAVAKSAVDEGYELLKQGKDREALEVFRGAFAAGQGSAAVYADAGYAARRLGEDDAAVGLMNDALRQSPGLDEAHERDVRLALADIAFAKQRPQEVMEALAPIASQENYAVQLRIAHAGLMVGQHETARTAAERAARLAASEEELAYARQLLSVKPAEQAHLGAGAGYADISRGYLLLKEGRNREALEAFQKGFSAGEASPVNYADAAYAARRAYDNDAARDLFARAIDANDKLDPKPLPEEQVFGARRANQELDRTWGFVAALLQQSNGLGADTRLPAIGETVQGLLEAYWQPEGIGYRDGKVFQAYARFSQTFHNAGIAGTLTSQGVLGVRYKPIGDMNLVVALEDIFSTHAPVVAVARDDVLLRLGYSTGQGSDLRPNRRDWETWNLYAETGYFLRFNPARYYANVEGSYGRSYRTQALGENVVLHPNLAISSYYDQQTHPRSWAGIGPGLKVRCWFREDRHHAPASYFDFAVGHFWTVTNAVTVPSGSWRINAALWY